MKNIILFIALLFCGAVFAGQSEPLTLDQCKIHAPFGFPKSRKESSTMVCRRGYVLEYDENAKIPVWVSYVLTGYEAVGCTPRKDAFAADRSVKSSSTPKDYLKSGYDMGHMANDGDMRWDSKVEEESFILSNIAPQLPSLNRGIWKKLEDYTRGWVVSRKNPLLIYVGPIYNRDLNPSIGNGVIVPSAFYKIIVDVETNEAMVFLFPHEARGRVLTSFMTSFAEVQRRTGVVFPLPKSVKISDSMWKITLKTVVSQRRAACLSK